MAAQKNIRIFVDAAQNVRIIKTIERQQRNGENEMTKVTYNEAANLWTVEVRSPVCGWIVQGEWASKEQAEEDARNWG